MIAVESNVNDVFMDLLAIFQGIPGILGQQQSTLQSLISSGVSEQFDALSRGEPVPSGGDFISWEGVSPLTEFVRETNWGTPAGNPILVVTGDLRRGLIEGTTYLYEYQRQSLMTYLPSVSQEERIKMHEEGFRVTDPINLGKDAPPRPMLFWGDELGNQIFASLERGIDNLARSRGFL